jgi:DNA-binding response OmpR family regulator
VSETTEKGKILIIDDEPSVADALTLILEDGGFRVAVARTGREGLGLARRERFVLTITDLRLPDMTGLDVLGALRGADPHHTVLLITADDSPEDFAEARRRGVAAILSKPFTPSEILRLVAAALAAEEF